VVEFTVVVVPFTVRLPVMIALPPQFKLPHPTALVIVIAENVGELVVDMF
jgi:hypothetical protein